MEWNETQLETKENGQNPDRRYCYVCEGKTDESKLKQLGCLFVVITGGKYIRKEILQFLKEVKKVREIVIITDPDGPGKQIEEKITEEVGPCLVAHAEKKKALYKGKVGIAEMDLENLKALLRPFIRHDLFVDENLSLEDEDFYELGLSGGTNAKAKREILMEKYHIPYSSSKNVEDALLMLGKSRLDIEEDLSDD